MQMPQVRIESTPAKIQINTINGQQTIEQPHADVSIEQPKAELSIHTTTSKLLIDQTQAWEDMGYKSSFVAARENADNGRQSVLEGIARESQQGDELMKIENKGNPIARQAKENAYDPIYDFNIAWIPSWGSVKIDYQPADVNIQVDRNDPRIDIQARQPNINYQTGRVDVSLKQYSSLKIDVENLYYRGTNFEMKI